MTWSIIARDEQSGRVGIIVATKFFAAGAHVPHIKTHVGAVASQAFLNPFYGPQGLALLQAGASAENTVKFLTNADDGRDHRQLHVMDREGRFAAYTGKACIEWCGHLIRTTCSVAGNMLAGPKVIEDTADTYEANLAMPFARRLIAAMCAGEAAGGDKRGKQSAALVIYGKEQWSDLDLRVDDHTDPLAELERLEQVSRERWVHFRKFLPNHLDPAGTTDRATIDAGVSQGLAEDR
jgi:uncharacterized Ntn-hydrolase superfamily protein